MTLVKMQRCNQNTVKYAMVREEDVESWGSTGGWIVSEPEPDEIGTNTDPEIDEE